MPNTHGGKRVAGAFQIRKHGDSSYQIGLPRFIGEDLHDRGLWYVAQYTDEGILLRPLASIQANEDLPEWVKREGN